ncbi:hypothetical protein [Pontibacter saemangeumensis]
MRKRIIPQELEQSATDRQGWLDLQQHALVEVTSEHEAHPIEAAFKDAAQGEAGWKASQPGKQTIRLLFDEPQTITRIKVLFEEKDRERTQEFVLRWLPEGEQPYREIVRQQYNFSPPHATTELEEYAVELHGVSALELSITPDIGGGNVCASLAQLRLR